jgi:hypothetical protein
MSCLHALLLKSQIRINSWTNNIYYPEWHEGLLNNKNYQARRLEAASNDTKSTPFRSYNIYVARQQKCLIGRV